MKAEFTEQDAKQIEEAAKKLAGSLRKFNTVVTHVNLGREPTSYPDWMGCAAAMDRMCKAIVDAPLTKLITYAAVTAAAMKYLLT